MRFRMFFLWIPSIIFMVNAAGAQTTDAPLINEFFSIKVNGTNQWLLIRGNDLSKPVLLYLHGGPGQSLVPYAHAATGKLLDDFIVVYWDQRGAGLSLSRDIPPETMNIGQFIDDTGSVTQYLKKRFKKDKIYLLGHSWGSVLGTLVVQKSPEDYYAYIGVGQVVNPRVQSRAGVEWLKKQILARGTPEEKNMIGAMEAHNFANRDLLRKYGGIVHNISPDALGAIAKQSPYFPQRYTPELSQQGLNFASRMWRNDVEPLIFARDVPELKLPIYFFLGRYDQVTPTASVVEYFQALKAPRKQIVWFEKSGHRMDVEEPDKFQNTILKIAEGRRIQ